MTIYNVKIHTMNAEREVIDNGYVSFENGVITKLGSGKPATVTATDFDGNGADLYPGFIDSHTHLGLTTNGVGVESEDFNEESDPTSSQLRIADGINPMDTSFREAVCAGITTAVVSPGSMNPVAGSIAAVKTVGKRVDKMLVKTVGMKFSMGENPKMTYLNRDESPCTRMAVAGMIRDALFKAKRYMENKTSSQNNDDDRPDFDIKSESLIPLLNGEVKAFFHCHRADDIFTAIRIANEFDLNYTLVHCTDGHLIADELREENATAIIGPIICDPCKPELANITPKNAGVLDKAGIKIAICTDHSEVPVQYLPISVGIAMKHGLDKQSAIEAVTINAAEISGISDRVGSVDVGKDADFVLFDKCPFEIMSEPEAVFVNGVKVV
ncbi:MAG: amidohydrolase [Ruminococcus sp.]|nr:amidohydrolase [Ruminococcus sp.]